MIIEMIIEWIKILAPICTLIIVVIQYLKFINYTRRMELFDADVQKAYDIMNQFMIKAENEIKNIETHDKIMKEMDIEMQNGMEIMKEMNTEIQNGIEVVKERNMETQNGTEDIKRMNKILKEMREKTEEGLKKVDEAYAKHLK